MLFKFGFLVSAILAITPAYAEMSAAFYNTLSLESVETMPTLSDPEVIRFQNDLTEIRALRIQTKKLYDTLAPIVKAGKPLSGDNLAELSTLTKAHSRMSKELDRFIRLGSTETIAFPMQIPQATRLALELASSLTFTDSVDQVVSIFDNSPELRTILNRPDPTYGRPTDVLYEGMLQYYSVAHYDRRAILIDSFRIAATKVDLRASPNLVYLAGEIKLSATYQKYRSQKPSEHSDDRWAIRKMRLELQGVKAVDRLEDFTTHTLLGNASRIFGNAIGSIQFRHGKLYKNASVAAKMKAILKPGDLLLEATPFRATSYLIPGNYGHVAMWVGTAGEMKETGIWNDPEIRNYQMKIAGGSSILEALRDGVQLNPVEHFLDIDDLLILRPNAKLSSDQIQNAIRSGMTHIGQAYDFNFDVDSNDTIVCSELAFATYTSVPFSLQRTMGRWTISPDDVAKQGLKGGFFTPVMMIHDGRIVATKLQEALAEDLK